MTDEKFKIKKSMTQWFTLEGFNIKYKMCYKFLRNYIVIYLR